MAIVARERTLQENAHATFVPQISFEIGLAAVVSTSFVVS